MNLLSNHLRARGVGTLTLLLLVSLLTGCDDDDIDPPDPSAESFLLLSDLHFNPLANLSLAEQLAAAEPSQWRAILESAPGQSLGTYGADTNHALMRSAFSSMQRTTPQPAFVLVTGDWLTHGFQEEYHRAFPTSDKSAFLAFQHKTMRFLAEQLGELYPDTTIYPVLGNNDTDCGDYDLQTHGPFLEDSVDVLEPLVNRHGAAPEFRSTYPVGGYYTAKLPFEHGRLIVLNGVFWSPAFKNECASSTWDPGQEELTWLEQTLAASARDGESVWLAFHIPPGIDVFQTLSSKDCPPAGPSCTSVSMYKPQYEKQLLALLRQHAGIIRMAFAGHTHMNEFRLLSAPGEPASLPLLQVGSISPIFYNNPSYFDVALEPRTGELRDYTAFVLTDLGARSTQPGWEKEYSFNEAYGQNGVTAASLEAVVSAIESELSTRVRYAWYYPSLGPSYILPKWRAYWCAINHLSPPDFERCYTE